MNSARKDKLRKLKPLPPLKLNRKATDVIVRAILSPPKPNRAARAAAKRYRQTYI